MTVLPSTATGPQAGGATRAGAPRAPRHCTRGLTVPCVYAVAAAVTATGGEWLGASLATLAAGTLLLARRARWKG